MSSKMSSSLSEQLHAAVSRGDDGAVREFLQQATTKEVNWKGENEASALIIASKQGHSEILELLLARSDVDVNLRDEDKRTALYMASKRGKPNAVRMLLERPDIEVNVRDEEGRTALMTAAIKDHFDVVKLLLGHPDIELNSQDAAGYTALMWASLNGHIEVVEKLLKEEKIQVNLQDNDGRTALMWAANKDHPAVVRLLVNRPDTLVNLQNQEGSTALMKAASSGRLEVVKILLGNKQVGISLHDKNGLTAIDMAKDPEIKRLLQSHVAATAFQSILDTASIISSLTSHDANLDTVSLFGAFQAPQSVAVPSVANPTVGWLAKLLIEDGVDERLANECDYKLVVREGFVSEDDLAELPPDEFTFAYLYSIGISARGLQRRILKLHAWLRTSYTRVSLQSLTLEKDASGHLTDEQRDVALSWFISIAEKKGIPLKDYSLPETASIEDMIQDEGYMHDFDGLRRSLENKVKGEQFAIQFSDESAELLCIDFMVHNSLLSIWNGVSRHVSFNNLALCGTVAGVLYLCRKSVVNLNTVMLNVTVNVLAVTNPGSLDKYLELTDRFNPPK